MKLTDGKLQAIMTCREFRGMGFQQIADYLMIPLHLAKDGYLKACKKGMKAKIPKNRIQRIDRKSKELTPQQYYKKMQSEKSQKAKGRRKTAWKAMNTKDRKEAKGFKRDSKLAKINETDPNRPPQRIVRMGNMDLAYEKYQIVEDTGTSVTYERPSGMRFTVEK